MTNKEWSEIMFNTVFSTGFDAYEKPKLYTSSKAIAAECRKIYPDIEIVITPKEYPKI